MNLLLLLGEPEFLHVKVFGVIGGLQLQLMTLGLKTLDVHEEISLLCFPRGRKRCAILVASLLCLLILGRACEEVVALGIKLLQPSADALPLLLEVGAIYLGSVDPTVTLCLALAKSVPERGMALRLSRPGLFCILR